MTRSRSRIAASVVPSLLLLWSTSAGATGTELFPRPAALEPDIEFWTDIYTQVTSDSGVLHDARHLGIRYETMALPAGLGRRARSNAIERRKKHYGAILEKLGRGERKALSAEEARVLSLWPDGVSNRTLARASGEIRFQLGQADRFRDGLIRSGEYKPFILETLAGRGLPLELAALPHVESSFEPRAYSKVGAAGMWQFTRSTGRRYMRVDHVVDERRDPYLSTVAAARLLENNHSVTGSWPLALTGYNHGVAGMRRAVKQLGTNDIETIVRRYQGRSFGFASRNFYVAFLAALQIDQNPRKYFGDVPLRSPSSHELLTVQDYVSVPGLAEALGLGQGVLEQHNPALQATVWSGNKYIPKGFTLRLPAGSLREEPTIVLASLDPSIRFPSQLPDVTHRVDRGDTLSGIARDYGVRIAELVELNGLSSRHRIRAGQLLRLPSQGQRSGALLASADDDRPAATVVPASVQPPAATVAAAGQTDQPAAIIEVSAPEAGSGDEAENIDATDGGLAVVQAVLAADPSDYSVAEDGSIEIQAMETLGHYGDWLELKTQRLRDINGYAFRRPVRIGDRLRLDFARTDRDAFEARRIAYHRDLQEAFFLNYRIRDSRAHRIRRGESIWLLAQRNYDVPVWLLRQYNPDLDLDRVRPGMNIQFPVLESIAGEGADVQVAAAGSVPGRDAGGGEPQHASP